MTRRHWQGPLVAAALVALLGSPIRAQLGSRTAEEWVATLDSPTRIATLKINEVVARLGLKGGDVVADIGAGSGLFEGALSAAVGPSGLVYAEDVDQKLVDHIAQRALAMNVGNVRTVLGTFTDPRLPATNVDLAFIYDVLHHIGDRPAYLKALATYLKPTARIAVVEFHPDRGGHANQPELQITRAQGDALFAGAGFKPVEQIDLFAEKWFVVYGR